MKISIYLVYCEWGKHQLKTSQSNQKVKVANIRMWICDWEKNHLTFSWEHHFWQHFSSKLWFACQTDEKSQITVNINKYSYVQQILRFSLLIQFLSDQSTIIVMQYIPHPLRDAIVSKKCSFFEHCSKGLWPPPLLFEHLSYFAGGIF